MKDLAHPSSYAKDKTKLRKSKTEIVDGKDNHDAHA